jgi:hypothetical protein
VSADDLTDNRHIAQVIDVFLIERGHLKPKVEGGTA